MARLRRVPLAVLGALAWALLGAATALATVALHARWWGLLLGLVVTFAWLVAAAGGLSRTGYAAGWAGFVAYVVVPRPEGDFLLAQTASAYAVLGTALLLVVVALATLPRPTRPG